MPVLVIQLFVQQVGSEMFEASTQLEHKLELALTQFERHEAVLFAAAEKYHAVLVACLKQQVYVKTVVGLYTWQCDRAWCRKCELVMQQERIVAWIRIAEYVLAPRGRLAVYVVGQEVVSV